MSPQNPYWNILIVRPPHKAVNNGNLRRYLIGVTVFRHGLRDVMSRFPDYKAGNRLISGFVGPNPALTLILQYILDQYSLLTRYCRYMTFCTFVMLHRFS